MWAVPVGSSERRRWVVSAPAAVSAPRSASPYASSPTAPMKLTARAEPRRRDRLVRALAAAAELDAGPRHGLAALGRALDERHDVHVRAAEHDDAGCGAHAASLSTPASGRRRRLTDRVQAPWQRLNFLPEPHGHGSFRPTPAPNDASERGQRVDRRRGLGARRSAPSAPARARAPRRGRASARARPPRGSRPDAADRPRRARGRRAARTPPPRSARRARRAGRCARGRRGRSAPSARAAPHRARARAACRRSRRLAEPPPAARCAATSSSGSHAAQPASIRDTRAR